MTEGCKGSTMKDCSGGRRDPAAGGTGRRMEGTNGWHLLASFSVEFASAEA